jgi:hypothetical protein
MHASQGALVPHDEPFDLVGSGPTHVVGVTSPGADTGTPFTCAVSFTTGGTETVEIGTRDNQFQSIPAGRRLPPVTATIVCDQRVSVSTGPAVLAYPVAGSQSLFPAYLAIALLGGAVFGRAARARRTSRRERAASTGPASLAVSSEPVAAPAKPGDHAHDPPHITVDDPVTASPRRSVLLAALFLLAFAGTLGMLLVAAIAETWAQREPVLNLLLLLVVLPAAFGAGALVLARRR